MELVHQPRYRALTPIEAFIKAATTDFTKPFHRVYEETETSITYEINQPNDTIGDQAFEWDIDGSERRKWEEHLQMLEDKGIRGMLAYSRITFIKNPAFDNMRYIAGCDPVQNYPLSSYKLIFLECK
jgi:hypothetical protein